jgi:ribosome-binding protein aMBF1 (putative translation factor)
MGSLFSRHSGERPDWRVLFEAAGQDKKKNNSKLTMAKRKKGVVAAARQRRRWTQFELAQRVGCSESQIAKIETGRVEPQDWLKEAIGRELGISTLEVRV